MVAFVIIAATLVPGNAFHVVFVKVGLGWGTLWIAACNTIITNGLTLVEIKILLNASTQSTHTN